MALANAFGRFSRSQFLRDVLVLASGTAVSQIVTLAAMPILSRIYEPRLFGVLGVFVSVTGIMTVISTFRYELGIVLAKDDDEAKRILILVVCAAFAIALLTLPVVAVAGRIIDFDVTSAEWGLLLILGPVSVFFSGSQRGLQFWATRVKDFKRVSLSEVVRSSITALLQIAGGLLGMGLSGLVVGRFFGVFAAVGALVRPLIFGNWRELKRLASLLAIKATAKDHAVFPKYNLPRAIAISLTIRIVTIYLGLFFDPVAAGLYWFTFRIFQAPITLVGNAVRRVFYKDAADLYRDGADLLGPLRRTTVVLGALALVPAAVMVSLGPPIFGLMFGKAWEPAGLYAQWLAISWFTAFINVPSAMLVPVFGLQKRALILEIVRVSAEIVLLPISAILGSDVAMIAVFSIITMAGDLVLVVYIFRFTAQRSRDAKLCG